MNLHTYCIVLAAKHRRKANNWSLLLVNRNIPFKWTSYRMQVCRRHCGEGLGFVIAPYFSPSVVNIFVTLNACRRKFIFRATFERILLKILADRQSRPKTVKIWCESAWDEAWDVYLSNLWINSTNDAFYCFNSYAEKNQDRNVERKLCFAGRWTEICLRFEFQMAVKKYNSYLKLQLFTR